jgi:23S rRNA pseudouridine1911/1915/1917 synthase
MAGRVSYFSGLFPPRPKGMTPFVKSRLDQLVRAKFDLSWGKARSHIETGKIYVNGAKVTDPGAPQDATAEIELKMNAPRAQKASPAGPQPEIVFQDAQLVVVNKPSGMSTVPYAGEPKELTLQDWLCMYLKQSRIEIVHRLDRETSGLLVFARNAAATKPLAQQFRFHKILRRYLALAHGEVREQTIRTLLVENRGDGLRGSRKPGSPVRKEDAKEAVTHVMPLAKLDGMTLIECRLETGRTHQIRIHLGEIGHPLVGERIYIREFDGEKIAAPRIMLHAFELGFEHPGRGPMRWTAQPPADFLAMLPRDARFLLIQPR